MFSLSELCVAVQAMISIEKDTSIMSLKIDLYIFNLILPFSVNLVISQSVTDSYIIGKIMSSSIG
ncbi:hypothetical protein AWH66_2013710 [Vibrio barjaei]|nr:hypothetical protein AWH66_2013710 [Vibrio barjaei]